MLKHHCNHHGGYLSGHEVVRNKELDDVDPIDHSREPSNQPHYQRKHQIQSSSLSDRSMNNRSQRVIIPLFLITLVITSLLLYSSDDCDFCHGGFGFARFDPSSTSTAETGVDRLSLPIITTGITAEGGVNPKFDRRHPTLLISERQLSTSDDQPTVTDGSRGAGQNPFSPPTLLFAIFSVILSAILIIFGNARLWLVYSIGSGTATASILWLILTNTLGPSGLIRSHPSENQNLRGFILLTVIVAALLLGITFYLVSSTLYPRSHWVALSLLSLQAGFILSILILLIGNNLTIHIIGLRWLFTGLITATSWLISAIIYPPLGICFSYTSLSVFLFFLGLDLMVNRGIGFNSGIRFFLDHNYSSAYDPPVSSRVFQCLTLLLIILGTFLHYWLYLGSCETCRPVIRDLEPARGLGLECDREAEDEDEDVDDNEEHDFQDTTCQNPAESHDLISGNKAQESFDAYKSAQDSFATERVTEEASLRNTILKNQIAVASESEHRNTPESNDTGLSAIPEATEQSKTDSTGRSRRRGSRNGSGSTRGVSAFNPQSYRHSSNSTSNSILRSNYSSDQVPPPTTNLNSSGSSGGPCGGNYVCVIADPSTIPTSPPGTSLQTETSVAPEDSASQAARRQLMIKQTSYLQPSRVAEEMEVVKSEINPGQDDQLDQGSTEPEPNMSLMGNASVDQSGEQEILVGDRNGNEDLRLGSRRGPNNVLERIARVFNKKNDGSSQASETQRRLSPSTREVEITMIESDYSLDVSPDGEDDEEDGGKNDGEGAVEDMTREDEERLLDSDAARWARLTRVDEVNGYNGEDAGSRIRNRMSSIVEKEKVQEHLRRDMHNWIED